ncbi:hypothetical protein L6452_25467 [Arctium lappa]|uniref:Uncharacterized protein n=1 Tax=Arctium lappa TaxID=4217 RepID=A0ACB9ABR7_ARCLA|nr:hypothetical protein L6452_25467 [Arctium lappa]
MDNATVSKDGLSQWRVKADAKWISIHTNHYIYRSPQEKIINNINHTLVNRSIHRLSPLQPNFLRFCANLIA